MKIPIVILLLAVAVRPVLARDVFIADVPTTTTNTVVTGTLPPVNLTRASQYAVCVVAYMEQTQSDTNLLSLPGAVTCTASNSLDTVTWFADPDRSFAFDVPTNGITALQTNFAGLGAIGYERYTISVSNNCNTTWTVSVKPGL